MIQFLSRNMSTGKRNLCPSLGQVTGSKSWPRGCWPNAAPPCPTAGPAWKNLWRTKLKQFSTEVKNWHTWIKLKSSWWWSQVSMVSGTREVKGQNNINRMVRANCSTGVTWPLEALAYGAINSFLSVTWWLYHAWVWFWNSAPFLSSKIKTGIERSWAWIAYLHRAASRLAAMVVAALSPLPKLPESLLLHEVQRGPLLGLERLVYMINSCLWLLQRNTDQPSKQAAETVSILQIVLGRFWVNLAGARHNSGKSKQIPLQKPKRQPLKRNKLCKSNSRYETSQHIFYL